MTTRNGSASLIFKLFASALFSLLVACSPAPTPEELIARANTALEEGARRAALIDAKAALVDNPTNPAGRRIVAQVAMWQLQFDVAQEELERGLSSGEDPASLSLYAETLVRGGQLSDFDVLLSEGKFTTVATDPLFLTYLARAQVDWGQPEDALASIGQALEQAPENPVVRLIDIEVQDAVGRIGVDEVIGRLADLAKEHPENDQVLARYGTLLAFTGDISGAVSALEQAIRVNPNRAADRLLLANLYVQQGEMSSAGAALDRAEKIIGESPRINLVRAKILIAEAQFGRAVEELNKVLTVAPSNTVALELGAYANFREKNFQTARRQVTTLLELQPTDTKAKELLARTNIALGDIDAANALIQDVLEADPMNKSARRALALIFALQGLHAESAAELASAAEAEPESVELLTQQGMQLLQAGDIEAAILQLENARNLKPLSLDARKSLVGAMLASGDYESAREEIASFLKVSPTNADALVLAAKVEQLAGDREKAVDYLQQALEVDAASASAKVTLADLRAADKDYEGALTWLDSALEDEPDNVEVILRKGAIYRLQGESDKLASTLEEGIERAPNSLPLRRALASHYLLASQGDNMLALKGIEALRDMPAAESDSRSQRLLATLHLRQSDYGSALIAAQRLDRLLPESPEGPAYSFEAFVGLQRLNDAEEAIREAIRRDESGPHRPKLIYLLMNTGRFEDARAVLNETPDGVLSEAQTALIEGRIYIAEGRLGDAAKPLEQAMELQPSAFTARLLAESYWRQGEQTQAIGALERALDQVSETLPILNQLSEYQLKVGDVEGSTATLTRMIEIAPDSVSILNNLAWTLRASDPEKSLAYSSRAVEVAPDNIEVRDTYAMVLLANNRQEEALEIMETLVEENPGRDDLAANLLEIRAAAGI